MAVSELGARTSLDPEVEENPIGTFVPLKWSLVWLLGTFVAFFFTSSAAEIQTLTPFVFIPTAGAIMLTIGYWVRSRRKKPARKVDADPQYPKTLIILSSIWSISYGLAYLSHFGGLSVGALVESASNLGAAYQAKFGVYEVAASESANLPIQLITLTGAFMTLLVPLMIIWWREMSLALRILTCVGAISFLLPFVQIGTNQGIGSTLILVLVGAGLVRYSPGNESRRVSKKALIALLSIILLALVFFLVGNAQRANESQIERDVNPAIAALVGMDTAAALDSAIQYPTHGYLGLAETLTQPFLFSGGYGNSRALTRYLVRYADMDDTSSLTYPSRTEDATGYPEGLRWHTVYPWLASDLTFVGAILFMAVVGWALANFWIGSLRTRDPVAIGLLGYCVIFIAFIPANNQIGISQTSLVGFASLLVIYMFRRVVTLRNVR